MTKEQAAQAGCDYGKGTRTLMKAMFGVLLAVLVTTVGLATAAFSAAASAQESVKELAIPVARHADRWEQLPTRLDRMEGKLDRLLEARRARPGG